MRRRFPWADLITWLRLAAVVPITLAVAADRREVAVLWCVLVGLTDFADGYVARRTSTASARGAALDSSIDLALAVGAVAWLWVLEPDLVARYWRWAAALFLFQLLARMALSRGRPALGGLHLWSGKLCIAAGYLLLPLIVLRGEVPGVIPAVLGLSTISTVEAVLYVGKGGRNLDARFFWDP